MPYTMLMIKPDAMRRPEVLAALDERIAAATVSRRWVLDTVLSHEQARNLFPSFDEERYPVTRALLLCYLTTGPVRFVVLAGPDALAAGKHIRRSIRDRFAVAPLANCLHAAADPAEAARQLAWLGATHGTPAAWAQDTGTGAAADCVDQVPGITGRLATADVGRLARQTWDVVERVGWDGLWQAPARAGSWVATLHSDDEHSLDYAVSALHETHPRLSAGRALQAVLRADQAGSAAVFAGRREAAHLLATALVRRGLKASAAQ